MNIPSDDTKNYPISRFQLIFKKFWTINLMNQKMMNLNHWINEKNRDTSLEDENELEQTLPISDLQDTNNYGWVLPLSLVYLST